MSRRNVYSLNAKLMNREYGLSTVKEYDFVLRKIKKSYGSSYDHNNERDFWKSAVFSSHFCPNPGYGSLLAVSNELGQVMLWDTKRNNYKDNYKVTEAHGNAVFDITWSTSELKVLTASGDTTIGVWDCGSDLNMERINTYVDHIATAKTVAWNPETSYMFCSADRSGTIMLWDIRTSIPANTITYGHDRIIVHKNGKVTQLDNSSISGLVFYQSYYMMSAAAGTPIIKMWDVRKPYAASSRIPQPVCEIRHNKFQDLSGYSYLNIDPAKHRLYATSVHDRIYSFALDTPDNRPAAVFVGGCLRSYYAKSSLSPDGNYLISGSSSEYAVMWNTNRYLGEHVEPLRKLRTTGLEVNTVAWCRSSRYLLKVVLFPECDPCTVFDINPESIDSNLWDSEPLESENTYSYEQQVSELVGDLSFVYSCNRTFLSVCQGIAINLTWLVQFLVLKIR